MLVPTTPEAAVEAAGAVAAAAEQELERGHVPSALPDAHRPGPELGTAATAQGAPGPWARDAVGDEVPVPLEAAHRAASPGTGYSVDRTRREPDRTQPHLECGDVGPATPRRVSHPGGDDNGRRGGQSKLDCEPCAVHSRQGRALPPGRQPMRASLRRARVGARRGPRYAVAATQGA